MYSADQSLHMRSIEFFSSLLEDNRDLNNKFVSVSGHKLIKQKSEKIGNS